MASLYQQSIPPMTKWLNNLSTMLIAAVKYANEDNEMTGEKILDFKLIEGMRGLAFQVQSCCDTAKFFCSRIGAMEDVYFEDNETTLEQLQTRIARTIKLLQTVDREQVDSKGKEEVLLKVKTGGFMFDNGQNYLLEYALPYFHMHFAAAYYTLRHLGVPVGGVDYVGAHTFTRI